MAKRNSHLHTAEAKKPPNGATREANAPENKDHMTCFDVRKANVGLCYRVQFHESG